MRIAIWHKTRAEYVYITDAALELQRKNPDSASYFVELANGIIGEVTKAYLEISNNKILEL